MANNCNLTHNIQFIESPNFSSRSITNSIDTIVIHHTNMEDIPSVTARFMDPNVNVSAHYLISKAGGIIQYVHEEHKAHHAGVSYWRGRDKINEYSIGIELENRGNEEFPEAQISSLISLMHYICDRHPIDQRNIVAHYDIAPDRKDDPNEYFPWEQIANLGLGIYCNDIKNISEAVVDISHLKQQLSRFGYLINDDTHTLQMAVIAFRKHYCTRALHCGFWWDTLSQHRLDRLMPDTLDS